jgi:hypothetical protein
MTYCRPPRLLPIMLALLAGAPLAQTQKVKPPQAQAWIDIATFAGMSMPMGGAGGADPMAMLGGLLGGGGGKNSFGRTHEGGAGRWVDVTLSTRANPSLAEAQQAVPAGFLSPALKLQAPRAPKLGTAPESDDTVTEPETERPKGRLLMYWGCGTTIRPGQPKVLDMATAAAGDIAKFFVARRATQRGTHSAPGRPVWPSEADPRMVPAAASLVGAHAFSGTGVPEEFRFHIPAMQDLMPALQVKQADQGGANALSWAALPTARAYFVAGMGMGQKEEMVIWTSSEVPETGLGLLDYQTNPAVDRWLREGVLLAPTTPQCTVPKGVFSGEGGMLRVIAYGSELNLAHPPRPKDPKETWEPVWAVKLRVKSVATVMPGMDGMGEMPGAGKEEVPPRPAPKPEAAASEPTAKPDVKTRAIDALKGIFGR